MDSLSKFKDNAEKPIVQVWKTSADARAVLDKGYNLVHSPSDYFYLVRSSSRGVTSTCRCRANTHAQCRLLAPRTLATGPLSTFPRSFPEYKLTCRTAAAAAG